MEAFGKYQLIRRLGAGGMAEVFLAREPLAQGLAKILVIKKIHPSLAETPQFRQMFEDEAKVAVNLNHPNIVQTFGYGQIGPTYYLAMEHVEGVDLLRVLNAGVDHNQRISFGLCAYLGQQVAKALDYAHRKTDEYGEPFGIVHRDVSPQNILVSWDGMVKLVDFGIARARHVKEEEGVVKGKFAYMSPEQAAGAPVDPRSDIFSTGIVLWEITCARALFGNLKGKQAINAIKNAQVPRPREIDPSIPAELEAIILRCLQRKQEDRYQTARDLHRALGQFFFALSSKEGKIFESGAMAGLIAQLIPEAERNGVAAGTPSQPQAGHDELDDEPRDLSRPSIVSKSGHDRDKDQLLQPAERKSVIVVEGDLSALAALRRNMGEARSREALLDFLRVTEHVAYKHQAHPDRLDDRGFTYVLGLPVGTEDDAARAVELSRALIDALEGISRELSPPLKLAIGLSRGTALVSRSAGEGGAGPRFQYELLGQTAQIARRLATEAMPGEILVGGGIFRAARTDWNFEELDAIELPPDGDTSPGSRRPGDSYVGEVGGPARAKVYRLMGPRPRAERLADHAGLRRLVGREIELSMLMDVHRAVVEQNRARYALVLGEAGVGKASIVDAFRHKLDPMTHLVLRAVGRPGLKDNPYAMIADLTRDLFGLPEDAEPREVKRRIESAVQLLFKPSEEREARQVADALGVLLGVKVAGADELDASERRHRLYAAMRKLQTRLAEGRTLVVVVEDMHWADSQSFEILTQLVRDPIDRPVLGVGTARHQERIDLLAQSDQLTTILVGELGVREREELVAGRFVDAADARAIMREILDRAGGNPFYINEIIESLVERGILEGAANDPAGRLRWVRRDEAVSVPTTVEAVVAARIDLLPDDERDTIRRAALLGRVFRVEDLQALTGAAAPETLTRALVRLASRGIIAPASSAGDVYARGPGAYAFRNTITKQVAYDGLAPETRALLHSVAADRMVRALGYRKGADDARLAEHLAASGDRPAAGRALVSAGLYARDNAGNADAFTLLTRALGFLPPDAHQERYDVHAEREQILRGWGKRPAQLREVHHMRKHAAAMSATSGGRDGKRREAEAFCRLGLLYLDVGKHAAARRELDRALQLAREAHDSLAESEALRLSATLLMNIGRNAEALELALKALAVVGEGAASSTARASDRDQLLARAQALNAVGNVHVHTGRLREAVSNYAEALVIYRRLAVRRLEAAALNNMGWVFVGLGEYEEALVHYKRSLRLAQELGDRAGIGVKLANIGQTYTDLGDFERARRYLDKALEIHTALGDQPGLADALISLAQVSLREGKPEVADQQLERGLELASETRNRYQEIRALVYLAFCRLDRGGPEVADGAFELAQSATKLAREAEIANGEVYGLCAEALALGRAGRTQEALARSTQA
ncbi:MAG: serine/threonine protein kinase with repeat, partial [Myxococcales bacterium]|nr:serine/threonine protein kinase with repeat [Myxococcales bacterium]